MKRLIRLVVENKLALFVLAAFFVTIALPKGVSPLGRHDATDSDVLTTSHRYGSHFVSLIFPTVMALLVVALHVDLCRKRLSALETRDKETPPADS